MLPNSKNQNGKYEFIQGDYKSVIKRNASEILNDLGIKLNLDIKFEPHIEKDNYVPYENNDLNQNYISDDKEMLLINGLNFECEIHHHGRKLDSGKLSLFPLFCAINCLSTKNREIAYNIISNNPHLSFKPQANFDYIKNNCVNHHSNINVLRKIIKIYNPTYYQQYLNKK